MNDNRYVRPTVRTMTGAHVCECLGPVSCGSANGSFEPNAPSERSGPVGIAPGGSKIFS